MHVLDIIMYFVLVVLLWKAMDYLSDGDYTRDHIGCLMGLFWVMIFTIAYITVFGVLDHNWIDIFRNMLNILTKTKITIQW